MNIVVNEILVNFEIFGNNHKKVIVILHGWKNDITSWIKVAEIIANNGYKVILIDLPGFGLSNTPNTPWGIQEYTIFVKSFIKKMGITKYNLIGHSLGGKLAAHLCVNNSQIIKLFLIAPSGVEVKDISIQIRMALFKTFKFILFFLPIKIKKRLAFKVGSEDYKDAGDMLETFKKVVNVKLDSIAKKIKCPTTIIWGDMDNSVSVKGSKILRALIANSHIRIIWGKGHLLQIEAPDTLADIILNNL